jgi:hypothetical protein
MTRWKSLAALAVTALVGLGSASAQDKLPRPTTPLPPPPPPINIGTIPGGGVGPVLPVPGTRGNVTITPGVTFDGRPAVGGGVTIPLGKP